MEDAPGRFRLAFRVGFEMFVRLGTRFMVGFSGKRKGSHPF